MSPLRHHLSMSHDPLTAGRLGMSYLSHMRMVRMIRVGSDWRQLPKVRFMREGRKSMIPKGRSLGQKGRVKDPGPRTPVSPSSPSKLFFGLEVRDVLSDSGRMPPRLKRLDGSVRQGCLRVVG